MDCRPRTPEVPVVLVVPAVDRSVGGAQIQHREEEGAVTDVDGVLVDQVRATPFHASGGGAPCQKIAMCVCSGVRTVLFTEPSAFTSLKSSAYASLVSEFGPSVWNCDELCIRNGRTFATHGVGSRIGEPSGFRCGC